MTWSYTGLIIVLIAFVFDLHIFSTSNFDGKTMQLSGEKIFSGNLVEVYDSIEGLGPFTYSPFSFPFFSLHYFVQKHLFINLNSFLNLIGLAFITYSCLSKVGLKLVQSFVMISFVLISFGFVIQESINIQQIDLFFVCFFYVFILNPKNRLNVLFCTILLFIKPQIFFLPLLILLYIQRKHVRLITFTWIMLLSIQFIFFGLNKVSWSTFMDLWRRFLENATPISQNLDVTNQSLSAVINRLLCSPTVGGRYFPSDYTSTPIKRIDLFVFNRSSEYLEVCGFKTILLVNVLWLGLISFALLQCIHLFYDSAMKEQDSILVQMSILLVPFFAPLFWNVYFVYLIPVFVTFGKKLPTRQIIVLGTPLLLFAICANRRIFDANFVDSSLYLGATFFYWLAFFIIFGLTRTYQFSSSSRAKLL